MLDAMCSFSNLAMSALLGAAPIHEGAPIHLGVKGAWTEKMQNDWSEFHIHQHCNLVDYCFDFVRGHMYKCLIVARLFLDLALGYSWYGLLLGSLTAYMVAIFVFAYVYGSRVQCLARKHPLRVSTQMQVTLMSFMQVFNFLTSLSMETELLQHRMYLTSQTVTIVLMSCVVSLPLWHHVLFSFTCIMVPWIIFHRVVGYWRLSMICFAIVGCVLVPSCCFAWREKLQWQQFHANRQLDCERDILEATQTALRCLLSSLWDASCTCDITGVISSSTPHLNQLLGGGGDLADSSLCKLATNEFDSSRLEGFLKGMASPAMQQASTLQCTLRSRCLGSYSVQDTTRRPETYEVALHGIKLPPGAVFHSNSSSKLSNCFFIGIKASTLETSVPDAACMMRPHVDEDFLLQSLDEKPDLAKLLVDTACGDEGATEVPDSVSVIHGTTSVVESCSVIESCIHSDWQMLSNKTGVSNGRDSHSHTLLSDATTQTECSELVCLLSEELILQQADFCKSHCGAVVPEAWHVPPTVLQPSSLQAHPDDSAGNPLHNNVDDVSELSCVERTTLDVEALTEHQNYALGLDPILASSADVDVVVNDISSALVSCGQVHKIMVSDLMITAEIQPWLQGKGKGLGHDIIELLKLRAEAITAHLPTLIFRSARVESRISKHSEGVAFHLRLSIARVPEGAKEYVCWDMIQRGRCPQLSSCHWCHPELSNGVVIKVRISDFPDVVGVYTHDQGDTEISPQKQTLSLSCLL